MLFCSPQCYFRCTAGTQHKHAPNISCPERPHASTLYFVCALWILTGKKYLQIKSSQVNFISDIRIYNDKKYNFQ